MANKPIPLTQLHVVTPCSRDWDAMPGDARTRFCAACNQRVHDLSQMTRAEADRLLATPADRLCVRYAVDPDGQLKTLDYAPPRRPRFRARIWLPAAFLASAGAAVAHFLFATKVSPPPPLRYPIGTVSALPSPLVMGKVGSTRPTTQPADSSPGP